jgi:predicted alpha-1,2-mannosidase
MCSKLLCLSLALLGLTSLSFAQKMPVDYVNPMIGTGGHGHTFPGATTPNGAVQLSPDNGNNGWDWVSGYHYSDSLIAGFSHTHLSGTGITDLTDISILPTIATPINDKMVKTKFSHRDEVARAGYYSVMLKDYGIKAELTAGTRVGMHRYTLPKSDSVLLRLNLQFGVNQKKTILANLTKINDTIYTGFKRSTGWARDHVIFFAIQFSKPVERFSMLVNNDKIEHVNDCTHAKLNGFFGFKSRANEQLLIKVGVSSASVDGALKSLEEVRGWDFDNVAKKARQAWAEELSKIEVKTETEAEKEVFYTAMYHTMIAPNVYQDLNGEYKSTNGKVVQTDRKQYTVLSLWDVYRAWGPLMSVIKPAFYGDLIHSMLRIYDDYGLLPVWELQGNETNCMTGYHAIPIITDAMMKGIKGFDYEKAYQAMVKSAMQDIRGTNFYKKYGYVPQDLHGNSATITLEYAYDDWCIAQSAKMLGKTKDYEYFMNRSKNYINVFDPTIGFVRGKFSNGKWREPFDPYLYNHDATSEFMEGTAWQHNWYIPQDPYTFINLFGKSDEFIKKLDSLWTVSSEVRGKKSGDISGMIGQYVHGNEPSHHIPYLYAYCGQPHKSAEKVRAILSSQYDNSVAGLSGNDDCGQMSAWYIWSALGFYPVNPANSVYVFGSPTVEEASIQLPNAKKFKVKTLNNSASNIYIQKITLNGKEITRSYITHKEILNGGNIVFEMGSTPSENWGIKQQDLPPLTLK